MNTSTESRDLHDIAPAAAPRRGRTWLALLLAGGAFAAGVWLREPVLKLVGHDHAGISAAGNGTSTATQPSSPGKQLWTCSMHPQVLQDHPGTCPICHMELTPVKGAHDHNGMSDRGVQIDPVVVQNMGVRTAPAEVGPLVQSVRVVGYFEEPEPFHRDINLRVNGWIEKLYANVDGMAIEEGKPLFDLYSPELTVAIDELIAARKQNSQAASQASGDTMIRSLYDSAKRKLTQFGLGEQQIEQLAKLDTAPQTVPILAPLSGHLTAKMVYEGAAVKAGDLVLRLASRHRMWIDAQVYEQQMPFVRAGQKVRATSVSQPGRVFEGTVLFIHPHVDPTTRTALVRIEVPNEDLLLRQGMYASVELLADTQRTALLIPREAVIDTGVKQVAFVSLGEGKFEPRDLQLGSTGQGGTVEVVAGVKAGEQVVVSGQFLIDSESRLKEAIAKHLSAGLVSTTVAENPTPAAARATPPAPTTAPADAAAPLEVPHTDDIVAAYLVLARQLGEKQKADAPLDAEKLIDVASMASHHAQGEAAAIAAKVAEAATALRGQPLAEQRKKFGMLGDAVIALVKRSAPSPKATPALYILHCPMAFDDIGGNWLQDHDDVANPFYATQMKTCGEVVGRVEMKR